MAFGPGKHDDLVTRVRSTLIHRYGPHLHGVLLVVLGPPDIAGCSIQADEGGYAVLPLQLRLLADEIEAAVVAATMRHWP